jgi:peptidoglycan/LPS O-acetylase OafA/YrhL
MANQPYRYRPALDGLRAIAVLGVMLYHGLVSWLPGGFLGVDVFFVLSGYLITSILLAEWQTWRHIDLVGFYLRRARRLLPALVVVVLAVAVWARLEAAPDKYGEIRWDGVSTLLYVANWRFVFAHQSYFDQFGDPSPFRHMWSLGIEEQFYLVFPLLFVGLLAVTRGRRTSTAVWLGVGAVISALVTAFLFDPAMDPSRVYYGTDTRAQELLIGASAAVLMSRRAEAGTMARRAAAIVSVAAIGAILAAFADIRDSDAVMYRGGFFGFAMICALLIAAMDVAPRGPVTRLLSLPPAVWTGKISYGLYLWHWPVYIALSPARAGLAGNGLLAVRIAVTFAAAILSYLIIERPIRAGALSRMRPARGRVIATLSVPLAVGVLVGSTVGGTAAELPQSPFATTSVAGAGQTHILVVGDSVGFSLVDGFDATSYPHITVASSVKLGCGLARQQVVYQGDAGLLNTDCKHIIRTWMEAVHAQRPQVVVLVIGAWEVFDHEIDGADLTVGSQRYATYLTARLERARTLLSYDDSTLVIPNVPCYGQVSSTPVDQAQASIREDPERVAAVNQIIGRFVGAHPGDVRRVDLAGFLCPTGSYLDTTDGVQMRYDGVHFSKPGAAKTWQWLMPRLLKLAGRGG